MGDDLERVRIDRWLWAARFFKTRALAAEAVKGGRVEMDGRRVKPAKEVGPGDRLEIRTGETRRTVDVRGIVPRRVSAAEAAGLYEETPESIAARERAAQLRRAAPPPGADLGMRPTKRDRRRLDRARGR